MPSPFPGMDPYLESAEIWPDVHHGLISVIQETLNPILRPRYVMIKAIVKNGVVVPRDPLPQDWREGTEVDVEKSAVLPGDSAGILPADVWMDEVERCAAQQDLADDLRLQQAVDEERRLAKDLARP